MSKSIAFFATSEDLKKVVAALEEHRKLQYVIAGLFDSPEISIVDSVNDIETFGVAQNGDQAQERRYLILGATRDVNIREVPQRRGGVKFAVDQVQNPEAVAMTPGGLWKNVAVIGGQVGTATDDTQSIELFEAFEREIKRRFSKVKAYYVGPRARSLMESGLRLTTNVRSPIEYDVKP